MRDTRRTPGFAEASPGIIRKQVKASESAGDHSGTIADGNVETARLFERLLNYDGVRPAMLTAAPPAPEGPVLPMHFLKDRITLQLFTTIATLGTPQDITLQELRIESFFPMDSSTRDVFHDWARPLTGN